MTKGFAPILRLAVKSQAKRAEKRQLTPLGKIPANLLNYVAEFPDPRVQRIQKHLLKDILVISILAGGVTTNPKPIQGKDRSVLW